MHPILGKGVSGCKCMQIFGHFESSWGFRQGEKVWRLLTLIGVLVYQEVTYVPSHVQQRAEGKRR